MKVRDSAQKAFQVSHRSLEIIIPVIILRQIYLRSYYTKFIRIARVLYKILLKHSRSFFRKQCT